jgi:hypothetical protein
VKSVATRAALTVDRRTEGIAAANHGESDEKIAEELAVEAFTGAP